jgi:hypothetical protein
MAADFGGSFEELLQQAAAIEAGKKGESSPYLGFVHRVDENAFLNWEVKVRHLIATVCGEDSQHFQSFEKCLKVSMYETNYNVFQKARAVLLAAKEDYDGGYLTKIRNLIQAKVFDSELERAEELLTSGYKAAAAVIAGVVLETSIRQLCEDNGIATGKLDKMNADLAKAGVYNQLKQKRITALAHIRNDAAHGKADQFAETDASNMIRDIRNLLSSELG